MELMGDHRVLFVCHGNVFRSAFAHHLLQTRASELGITGLEVRSAGIRATPGQRPLALVQEIARAHGVELEHHRSTLIDEPLARWASEIWVMERSMGDIIRLRCPAAAARVSLLGELVEPGLEVLDVPSWPTLADAHARADELIATVTGRLHLLDGLIERLLTRWRSTP